MRHSFYSNVITYKCQCDRKIVPQTAGCYAIETAPHSSLIKERHPGELFQKDVLLSLAIHWCDPYSYTGHIWALACVYLLNTIEWGNFLYLFELFPVR